MKLVDVPPRRGLQSWYALLRQAGVPEAEAIVELAAEMPSYNATGEISTPLFRRYLDVQDRWYASLEAGDPDYDVYGAPWYLSDLWGCWVAYSRTYLRLLPDRNRCPPDAVTGRLGPVRTVVDLGNGFGFSTAVLAQLFPDARVVGTNLPGTVQWDLASIVADRFGFELQPSAEAVADRADVVFASEYMEHFIDPVAHLDEICDALDPGALIVANSFCTTSVGHFPTHRISGEDADGRQTRARFREAVEARGLAKLDTAMWNDRPQVYLRSVY